MPEGNDQLELADLIDALRRELAEAHDRAESVQDNPVGHIPFKVVQAELETKVETTGRTDVGGNLKFYVLSVGASKGTSGSHCHTIRLTLALPENLSVSGHGRLQ